MVNYGYISPLLADIIAFVGGAAATWSSPILPKLNSTDLNINPLGKPITSEETSWIASLETLGAIFGPLVFGYITDKFGRKLTILSLYVPFIISFATLAFAKIVTLYYIARFISGVALGGIYAVVPTYIGEVSESKHRGALATAMNCFQTAGFLFSFAVGAYVSTTIFNILLTIIPLIFMILFFFLGTESPYYYVAQGDYDAAAKSLARLRGSQNKNNDSELSEIKKNVENNKKGNLKDLFKSKGAIKAFIMCLALMAFQQLSGITAVLAYNQTIFKAAGSSLAPELCSIIVGIVKFSSSFFTPFIVDRSGRKILLYISTVGMCISQVFLGLYFYLHDNGTNLDSISWLPIVLMITFVMSNNFGLGPLPWTITAEVFPSNIKSIAASILAAFGSLCGFLMAKLLLTLGMITSFWLFAGFCVLAFFFVLFYVIETKKKTLQEIQEILES